jgi:hypothetical protein
MDVAQSIREVRAKRVPPGRPGMAIFLILNQWVVNTAEFGLQKASCGMNK